MEEVRQGSAFQIYESISCANAWLVGHSHPYYHPWMPNRDVLRDFHRYPPLLWYILCHDVMSLLSLRRRLLLFLSIPQDRNLFRTRSILQLGNYCFTAVQSRNLQSVYYDIYTFITQINCYVELLVYIRAFFDYTKGGDEESEQIGNRKKFQRTAEDLELRNNVGFERQCSIQTKCLVSDVFDIFFQDSKKVLVAFLILTGKRKKGILGIPF